MTEAAVNNKEKPGDKRSALFRTDGSQHLGTGHVMRCLAFAQGFEEIGVKSVFVIRDYEPGVAEIIRRYGYGVETIPQDCSFEEDASLTLKFASRYGAGLVVTDLGSTSIVEQLDEYREYLQRLKDRGPFLVTIDDLSVMPFLSDVVINPTHGAETMEYCLNGDTKFLLGSAYFIFRGEFRKAAGVNREIVKEARNILVTIGGSDPLNLTVKVARALCKLEIASNLNLRIVLGVGSSDSTKQELENALEGFTGNCELIRGSGNMAELMLWSDLAITGAGLTKYETAVTGTPSIIISRLDDQSKRAREFEEKGSTWHLGPGSRVDEGDIVKATTKVLQDYTLRSEMSKNGRKLVDGRGIERIISEIPRSVLS